MFLKEAIIDRHYRVNVEKLIRKASHRLSNDRALAEDVVNETYREVVENFSTFSFEKMHFNAWFNTIFNRTLHRVKNEEAKQGEVKDNKEVEVEDEHEDRELMDKVSADISEIADVTRRKILFLHYVKGFSQGEIHNIVPSVSLATTKRIISLYRPDLIKKYA